MRIHMHCVASFEAGLGMHVFREMTKNGVGDGFRFLEKHNARGSCTSSGQERFFY